MELAFAPPLASPSALITLPRVKRLLLIWPVSFSISSPFMLLRFLNVEWKFRT